MNSEELEAKVIALEALVSELLLKMPAEEARHVTSSAMPALQRSANPFATKLLAEINRRIAARA